MSRQNRRGALSVCVFMLIVAGCGGQAPPRRPPPPPSRPSLPPPTKAPAAVQGAFKGRIDTATRAQILTYAHALAFDSSSGASDIQRLEISGPNGGPHYGPLVRIEPEFGAVGLTRGELAEGRIVARMVNYDKRAYPKLGIPPHGTAYFWMDSTATGQWRAIYIPDNKTGALLKRVTETHTPKSGPPIRDSVIVHLNPDSIFRSRAKWLWSNADEGTWTSCTMTGCCYSNSKQFTGSP